MYVKWFWGYWAKEAVGWSKEVVRGSDKIDKKRVEFGSVPTLLVFFHYTAFT